MSAALIRWLNRLARYGLVLLPWVLSLYLHYWLLDTGTWEPRTPFRGLLSVALLATGLGLSFVVYSLLFRRKR